MTLFRAQHLHLLPLVTTGPLTIENALPQLCIIQKKENTLDPNTKTPTQRMCADGTRNIRHCILSINFTKLQQILRYLHTSTNNPTPLTQTESNSIHPRPYPNRTIRPTGKARRKASIISVGRLPATLSLIQTHRGL